MLVGRAAVVPLSGTRAGPETTTRSCCGWEIGRWQNNLDGEQNRHNRINTAAKAPCSEDTTGTTLPHLRSTALDAIGRYLPPFGHRRCLFPTLPRPAHQRPIAKSLRPCDAKKRVNGPPKLKHETMDTLVRLAKVEASIGPTESLPRVTNGTIRRSSKVFG